MTLAVFFPSLMGFGILVSGALLVADLVHRLLPNRGRRRRHRVVVGAFGVVARTARAAGRELAPPTFLVREFRSRFAYAAAAVLLGGAAALALSSGLAAHADVRGVFYESPWALGLGIGFGIGFGLLSLAGLVLVVGHTKLPRWVHWAVGHSPLGRLRVPARGSALATTDVETEV
jgi:uncharacterized BrkB/YihY/UPF0761 family membrane protein